MAIKNYSTKIAGFDLEYRINHSEPGFNRSFGKVNIRGYTLGYSDGRFDWIAKGMDYSTLKNKKGVGRMKTHSIDEIARVSDLDPKELRTDVRRIQEMMDNEQKAIYYDFTLL